MGTWSAAILGNDTSCEVYERFIELYNLENNPSTIAAIVLNEQQDNIVIDKTNVWLGLALACWECKVLSSEIDLMVKDIVGSGEDLIFCKELDASQQFLKARADVLSKFLIKLSVEKPKPRLIKKTSKPVQSAYLQGMCMAYKNVDDKYIGVFVHESEHFKNKGQISICFLDFELKVIPDISMFQKAKLFGLKKLGDEWGYRDYCGNVLNINYEKNSRDIFFKVMVEVFTVIGVIDFPDNGKWINNIRGGFMSSENSDDFIMLLEQLRYETKSKYATSDIALADFLKKLG